jgi:hypothetical protein
LADLLAQRIAVGLGFARSERDKYQQRKKAHAFLNDIEKICRNEC